MTGKCFQFSLKVVLFDINLCNNKSRQEAISDQHYNTAFSSAFKDQCILHLTMGVEKRKGIVN